MNRLLPFVTVENHLSTVAQDICIDLFLIIFNGIGKYRVNTFLLDISAVVGIPASKKITSLSIQLNQSYNLINILVEYSKMMSPHHSHCTWRHKGRSSDLTHKQPRNIIIAISNVLENANI